MPPETVSTNLLVLLIEDDAEGIETIRESLAHREGWWRLQRVGSVPTAIARVAGGGVSVVLLDLCLSRGGGDEGLSHFRQLHGEVPGVPIVVLCRAEEESLALSAVRAGAAGYMIKDRCATDLERLVQSVLERRRSSVDSAHRELSVVQKPGTMITLIGAKGGVGTTTVALNVGAVLARRNKAIVAELRSTLGTLSQFFRPQTRTRNITCLLEGEPSAMAEMQAASCLWSCKTIAGLSLLFGPQSMEPCQELGPAHAKAIVARLVRLADFTVADLPPALSETNRAVIQASNVLALVIERDSICMQAAKMILQQIALWDDAPSIGAILVNHAPVSSPASIEEIEMQLGIPLYGVIPPEPDICIAAQNARIPVVAFDSESLVAGSIVALAERLASPGQVRQA